MVRRLSNYLTVWAEALAAADECGAEEYAVCTCALRACGVQALVDETVPKAAEPMLAPLWWLCVGICLIMYLIELCFPNEIHCNR